jgi:CRISPR-associated endonuclease Cas2
MDDQEMRRRLAELLIAEAKDEELSERNAKLRKVLLLLAKGTALATILVMPGVGRLFKDFFKDDSDWQEWKMFNKNYLRQTIRKLEKKKIVEIVTDGERGEVRLTEEGHKKILKMGLESLTISRPDRWDGKWRMVFYDVVENNRSLREKFQQYLKRAGFFPLQKSVYIHAYPCEKEIEFLKYFLGIAGSVRIVIAEKIENDSQFRDYFGLS